MNATAKPGKRGGTPLQESAEATDTRAELRPERGLGGLSGPSVASGRRRVFVPELGGPRPPRGRPAERL